MIHTWYIHGAFTIHVLRGRWKGQESDLTMISSSTNSTLGWHAEEGSDAEITISDNNDNNDTRRLRHD